MPNFVLYINKNHKEYIYDLRILFWATSLSETCLYLLHIRGTSKTHGHIRQFFIDCIPHFFHLLVLEPSISCGLLSYLKAESFRQAVYKIVKLWMDIRPTNWNLNKIKGNGNNKPNWNIFTKTYSLTQLITKKITNLCIHVLWQQVSYCWSLFFE